MARGEAAPLVVLNPFRDIFDSQEIFDLPHARTRARHETPRVKTLAVTRVQKPAPTHGTPSDRQRDRRS